MSNKRGIDGEGISEISLSTFVLKKEANELIIPQIGLFGRVKILDLPINELQIENRFLKS